MYNGVYCGSDDDEHSIKEIACLNRDYFYLDIFYQPAFLEDRILGPGKPSSAEIILRNN